MKNTTTHRSIRRKHLRRIHPNNQPLVIDTTLGRKKHSRPPVVHPGSNTKDFYVSLSQQPRREGPPSPPAHLRPSIIYTPQPLAAPIPVRLSYASTASSTSHRQTQLQIPTLCHASHRQCVNLKHIQKTGDRYSWNPRYNSRSNCFGQTRSNPLSPKNIYHALVGEPLFKNTVYSHCPQSLPSASTDNEINAQPSKKSWIHLGFAAYMTTSLMLAYNGIMSVFLLQASRAPDNTNIPLFIFWLLFLFTAILSIFGFLALFISSWTCLRVYHVMYLLTSIITFTSMLGWLGVNKAQTGSWDRIQLDSPVYPFAPFSSKPPQPHEMWLKGLLERDPVTGTWVICAWKWILAFISIFSVQCITWNFILLAYDRQLRDWAMKDKDTIQAKTESD